MAGAMMMATRHPSGSTAYFVEVGNDSAFHV